MTHALTVHLPFHHDSSHSPHPGDGWKFGVAALSATVAGAIFLDAQLLNEPPAADTSLPTVNVTLVTTAPLPSETVTIASESSVAPQPVAAPVNVAPPVVAAAVEAPVRPLVAATEARPAADIRSIDPAALPGLQALARQLAGHIDSSQVMYADLTGDALDEAVAVITSDGTYGNLAFVVYMEKAGGPEAVFMSLAGQDRRGPSVALDHGQLVETRAVYGPCDPNSSPRQLVKRYFTWDGHTLMVDRTETVQLPTAKLDD